MYEILFRGVLLKDLNVLDENRWYNRVSAQNWINRRAEKTGLCVGDYSIREVNVNAGGKRRGNESPGQYGVLLRSRMRNLRTDEQGVANPDPVYHPPHYEKLTPEPIDVIESWGLDFHCAQVIKYIARAGNKPGNSREQDLRKARYYLDRCIALGRRVA
jgi:hypothetical protein